MPEPTSYFRYEDKLRGSGYVDEFGEYVSTGSYVELQLQEFRVIKETPNGARLDDYSPDGRVVLRTWNKQWASPTVEEARQSFIARKKRQVRILEAQLRRAKEALTMAEVGAVPREVPWLVPRPDWARATDPTATVALEEARKQGHKHPLDWTS